MSKLTKVFDSFTSGNIFPVEKPLIFLEARSSQHSVQKSFDNSVESYRPPKEQLRSLVGKIKKYPEVIGPHPDFETLELGEVDHHYIVSVFVDIQGSTILGTKLPLEQVRFIKNGILTTAIDIFQAFDGHIHRLQGDAMFAFFGRKNMTKSNSIIDALNASASLQEFCKSSLAKKFEEQGYPPVRIRIGIDFGNDEQVLWSHYGIQNCNEITTTSVHTDLAAKMQGKAPAGGIIIGNNIKEYLDLPDEFYSIKKKMKDGEQIEDRYAMNNSHLTYRMWLFNWERYLSSFLFFSRESRYLYAAPKHLLYRCFYKYPDQENYSQEYLSNCGSIPKDCALKFSVEIPSWLQYSEIDWRVINRGREATDNDSLNFPMPKYKNKKNCYQYTAYKGHHYMQCTIKNRGKIVAQEHFGVYISDQNGYRDRDGHH